MSAPRRRPPAILLGGAMGNSLSVARSLGRSGVEVHVLPDAPADHSRYARTVPLPSGRPPAEAWAEFLLGPASDHLRGAVLLACCDAGIELLIERRAELAARFVLDVSDREVQRRLLGKLSTYEAARDAGVGTPRFWAAGSVDEVRAREQEYVFPLIVKPLYSHRFQAVFGDKFFRVTDFRQLVDAYTRAREHDLDVVLLEEIPGPDDLLCSYYTYLDEDGTALCDFTKRIVRRYPENRGLACYHVTDWNPEARDLGLRLFRHIGLRGVGNVEFKRDTRDGRLKVIECNARFTAGNNLLVASGYDLALFVYNRLAGVPQPQLKGRRYAEGLHYWFPEKDLRAFLQLRAEGKLDLPAWLASLAHRQVLPYMSWDDPLPSLYSSARFARRAAGVAARRLRERLVREQAAAAPETPAPGGPGVPGTGAP